MGQDPAGVGCQLAQEVELGRRQVDFFAFDHHDPSCEIDHEIAEL